MGLDGTVYLKQARRMSLCAISLLALSSACLAQAPSLLKRAEGGDANAQFELAQVYRMDDRARDLAKTGQWLRRAADQGHPMAQMILGNLLIEGVLGKSDPAAAARLQRMAAEQGLPQAQQQLADALRDGIGVEANPAEAVQWYRRAAVQGQPRAQKNLAQMYFQGAGIPRNFEQAYFWALLAGVHDEQVRRAIGDLEKQLSQAQISKLQTEAATWKAKPDPLCGRNLPTGQKRDACSPL